MSLTVNNICHIHCLSCGEPIPFFFNMSNIKDTVLVCKNCGRTNFLLISRANPHLIVLLRTKVHGETRILTHAISLKEVELERRR